MSLHVRRPARPASAGTTRTPAVELSSSNSSTGTLTRTWSAQLHPRAHESKDPLKDLPWLLTPPPRYAVPKDRSSGVRKGSEEVLQQQLKMTAQVRRFSSLAGPLPAAV